MSNGEARSMPHLAGEEGDHGVGELVPGGGELHLLAGHHLPLPLTLLHTEDTMISGLQERRFFR